MKKIFTFLLLYCFLFAQSLYADQTRRHVSTVVGNATINIDLAMPQPMSSWQHDRQQDSAATSHHEQHRLGSTTANVASTATLHHSQHRIGSTIASIT
jgi:hypothetical protein